jgi:hypothetical protein
MITITKTSITNYLQTIEIVNPEFYATLEELLISLPIEKQYVYHIGATYGDKIAKNGRFFIFDREANHQTRFINTLDSTILSSGEFKVDIANSCFPLSMVIKNHLEVFTSRKINKEQYKFPLNIIKEGQFIGTWECIDKIYNLPRGRSTENWSVVSGRECFVTFFKGYKPVTKENEQSKIFRHLFNFEAKNQEIKSEDAIQSFIVEHFDRQGDVEFLVFPFHYLANNYNSLIEYIFKKAWIDKNAERDLHWENLTLKESLERSFSSPPTFYETQFSKHLINVVNSNHFYLKEPSLESIEGKALLKMIEILKEVKFDQKGNSTKLINNIQLNECYVPSPTEDDQKVVRSVFELFIPFFMIYDIGWKKNDKGFTFLSNPPIMISEIPKFRKDNISSWTRRLSGNRIPDIPNAIAETVNRFTLYDNSDTGIVAFLNANIGFEANENSEFDFIKLISEEKIYFSINRNNVPTLFKKIAIFIKNENIR